MGRLPTPRRCTPSRAHLELPYLTCPSGYAATWVGKGDIVYAGEGMNSDVAVSRFPNGAMTFHVAGKIQASSVPRDMRLQRMVGHLPALLHPNPVKVLGIGFAAPYAPSILL